MNVQPIQITSWRRLVTSCSGSLCLNFPLGPLDLGIAALPMGTSLQMQHDALGMPQPSNDHGGVITAVPPPLPKQRSLGWTPRLPPLN